MGYLRWALFRTDAINRKETASAPSDWLHLSANATHLQATPQRPSHISTTDQHATGKRLAELLSRIGVEPRDFLRFSAYLRTLRPSLQHFHTSLIQ